METAESKFAKTSGGGHGSSGNSGGDNGGGSGFPPDGGGGGGGDTGGGTQGENQPAILDIQGGVLQASTENAVNKFTFNHAGGEITFVRANEFVDSNLYPNADYTKPTTWKSGFIVLNETQIEVTRPYQIFEKSSDNFIIPENLINVPFSMSFEALVHTPATSSDYLTSYADVTLGNLRTLSGDVHRAKIFVKEQNKANAEFVKIGDFQLQPKNELKDDASATGELSLGLFYSQSVIDTHWISSSNTSTVISQNNQKILNAALLKGSSHPFTFKTRKNFTLQKNEDYITSFDGYYNKVSGNAEIELFITGSSLSSTNQEFSLGRLSSDPTSDFYSPKMANDSGSLQGIYNFFKTHQLKDNTPSTAVGFRVHSGEFHIANVGILPVSDRNFNPGFVKTRVPMPPTTQRGQRFEFVTEFYDFNNNKAQIEAITSQSIQFNGPPQVMADGEDATFSGSAIIGKSIQMYGVNPAFIRSVGYQGFTKTTDGSGERDGGFMLWSGSVGTPIGASEAYNGVGLEIVDASATDPSNHRFLQFASNYKNSGNSKFKVQTDEFLLGISSSANNNYISGSNGNLEISSSNFALQRDGDVVLQGTITAEAGGTIGGFTIGSDSLTATNFILDTGDKTLTMGTGNNIFIADSDVGIQLGHATFGSAPFRVTKAGVLTATSATIQGAITATSGEIGGFTIDSDEIKSTNLLLDSNNEKITVGSANAVTIQGGGTDNFVTMGKTTFGQATTVGAILGMDATVPTLELFKDANNQFIFNGSGIDIKSATFDLATSTMILDSGTNSGKISLGSTPNTSVSGTNQGIYMDGTGDFLARGNASNFLKMDGAAMTIKAGTFDLDATTLIMDSATNSGVIKLGASGGPGSATGTSNGGAYIDGTGKFNFVGDANNFIRFNSSGLEINTAKFDVNTSGEITATGGTIGGFTISSTQLTGGSGDDFIGLIPGTGIQMGNETFADAEFSVTKAGALKSTSGTMGGFTIAAGTLTGGNVQLAAAGTIKVGSVTDATTTATTNAGFFADNSGNVLIKGNTNDNDFIKVTGGGGIDIKTQTFKLDTDRLDIDSSTSRISIFDDAGSPKEVVRIGEVDGASNFGMKIFDGTGTADSDILVEFSETQNKIGGFTIDGDSITGGNLILNSAGIVESSTYVSGLKGFRLSAENNGFLEVENAKIRGTLRTTVFEKESVNAVGGQLQVGNSTTITGSAQISATATSIPVENVTGFTGSEIIMAKKVGNTGFSTEYMLITSQSRRDKTSDTDFSGSIFVVRGYSGSLPVANMFSGSIGDTGNAGTTLEPGQVLVSTGHFNAATGAGSGYIRMNANPNDPATPYIDIVERTGSKIYEVDLKARLGDLSGLSTGLVGSSPGFGLFTDRAFLTQDVTVGTLGAEHILISGSYLAFKDNNTIMAELQGTSWTLGGATGTTTDVIKIAPGGVFIYDNSNDYVKVTSAGLSVYESGNNVAQFGTDAIIGEVGSGKRNVKIDADAGILIRTNETNLANFDTDITLGEVGTNKRNVFIDASAGVKIRNNTTDIASFGSDVTLTGGTFTINDGTRDRLIINSSDITMTDEAGNDQFNVDTGVVTVGSSTDQVKIDGTSGITIRENDADSISLVNGVITVGSATDKVTINGTSGITIRENDADTISMVNGVVTVGSSTDKVTINGTSGITIRENDADTISMVNGVVTIGSSTDQVEINGTSGITIRENNKDNITLTDGTIKVGVDENNSTFIQIDSDSVDIIEDVSGTNNTVASFGVSTTIGSSTDKVSISASGLTLRENNVDTLTIASGVVTVGSSTDKVTINGTSGITIRENDSDTISMVNGVVTIGSSTDQVEINGTSGITIRENNKDNITLTDGTIKVGVDENNSTFVKIDSDSVDIIEDVSGTDNTVASFGVSTTIGSSTDKVSISASGITIRENNKDVITMASDVVTVGSSTDKVTINGTSGITIRENDVDTIALSGGAVVVGEVGASKSNVQITSGAINLRNNTTTKLSLSTAGAIAIGSNFSVTSGGDVTMEGTVTATGGAIGGWTINTNDITGGTVQLQKAGVIQLTGNSPFDGASKDARGEISGSAKEGPSFVLKRKSYNTNFVDVVKVTTSGSYDNSDSYTDNEDKSTITITKSSTSGHDIATATFSATQTSWNNEYYFKAAANVTTVQLDTTAPSDGDMLDLGAANQVVEFGFQNLQEAAATGDGGSPPSSGKSLYRWRADIYQADTNDVSEAAIVGSFNISSVLTVNAAFSYGNITTPSTFFPFKRFIYVKITGTRYSELSGDNGSGTKHSLKMTGNPFSITSFVPKTRLNAVGFQSYSGPNQEVKFGAINEIKGDISIVQTAGDNRGNIFIENSATIGEIADYSSDFNLYVAGDVAASGNITAFYTSDKRLKKNIIEFKEGLTIINKLRPVRFDWRDDNPFYTENVSEYGLIAQEVEEVLPEVVGNMKDDYKGIKYEKIVPLLISSIKELTQRVEELEQDK